MWASLCFHPAGTKGGTTEGKHETPLCSRLDLPNEALQCWKPEFPGSCWETLWLVRSDSVWVQQTRLITHWTCLLAVPFLARKNKELITDLCLVTNWDGSLGETTLSSFSVFRRKNIFKNNNNKSNNFIMQEKKHLYNLLSKLSGCEIFLLL